MKMQKNNKVKSIYLILVKIFMLFKWNKTVLLIMSLLKVKLSSSFAKNEYYLQSCFSVSKGIL